jgi:hypothetical protein
MVGGPNGHRSNGSKIEGRLDPQLETSVPNGVPDGRARLGSSTADRMSTCQIYGSKSWCRMGCPMGAGRGARQGARRGPNGMLVGVPDGARRSGRRGQTECLTGPDGVPDGARWEPCHRPHHF